ncbi:hypothetical protein PFICI_07332 [Pestalotiopsis fici W106-1]|uniref:Uncharacterized protein n=1 Tax=Pestalotiopsis fici (strain W106-1 / CGMCC3.15140) TaxID=1229662 RepID=W3X110_PESFW|nr:uncharacterized protein PFICI_07332 [Pestalotiopsis fici W106-1]ETS79803.1 hypothetical protein PFICI_07332 [Pestalotiopsis fici W106-1]
MISPSKICALLLVSSATAHYPPVSGHDFDFDVVYPSGLSFSTSNPPTEPLPLNEIQNNATLPQITLRNVESASSNELTRYISFAVVTYVRPRLDNSSVNLRTPYFAWVRANQTVSENGLLGGGGSDANNGQSDQRDMGDFKNASLHVWQQTDNVTDYLFKNNVAGTLWWELGDIWANATRIDGKPPSLVGYDFLRATVDFNLRNDTTNTTTGDDESSTATRSISSGAVMAFCIIAILFGI